METILEKLANSSENDLHDWEDDGRPKVGRQDDLMRTNDRSVRIWRLEDKIKLLELYLIISKNETKIFDLIYRHHGCDSYEDIFRDYDIKFMKDKTRGVEIALEELHDRKVSR
jgi:hypothetical protein